MPFFVSPTWHNISHYHYQIGREADKFRCDWYEVTGQLTYNSISSPATRRAQLKERKKMPGFSYEAVPYEHSEKREEAGPKDSASYKWGERMEFIGCRQ